MSLTYSFFPGCSSATMGRGYTESFNYVADRVGIVTETIPDWNCCGATAGHMQSTDLGDALPARSLALSEEAYGDTPVLTLCSGCYQNLRRALVHGRESDERREHIEQIIERPWKASTEIVNAVEPFLEPSISRQVKERAHEELTGMKVACYYGCMLIRPRDLCSYDDDEHPRTMEQVVEMTGAETVEWAYKNECCGASHQVSAAKECRPMIRRIFEDAAENGATAIATACPLCQLNLDMREAEVNEQRAREGLPALDIPVYYFTELLAASFGATAKQAGLTRHFHPALDAIAMAIATEPAPKLDPEAQKAARIAAAKKKAAARKAAQAKAASKKADAPAAKEEATSTEEVR